jgi:hypothetical protein
MNLDPAKHQPIKLSAKKRAKVARMLGISPAAILKWKGSPTILAQLIAAAKARGENPYSLHRKGGLPRGRAQRWMAGEEPEAIAHLHQLADYLGLTITLEPKATKTTP